MVFTFTQFLILSRWRKTYRNWRHVIQEFLFTVSSDSFTIFLVFTAAIPWTLFFINDQDQQLASTKFKIFTLITSEIFFVFAITFFSMKVLIYSNRGNVGAWLCSEIIVFIYVSFSFSYFAHTVEEGKNLAFFMKYGLGIMTKTLLMISLKFEKWSLDTSEFGSEMETIHPESKPLLKDHHTQQLIREFLEDYLYFTRGSRPGFVPRCKDFKELYYRYFSEDSQQRIEIPQQVFKVLKEKVSKNQFEEATFMPVFEYCKEIFESNIL